MAVLTGLDIVYNGLTFCIDPYSKMSVGITTADEPMTAITDVSRSGLSMQGNTAQVRDNAPSSNFKPVYRTEKQGTINFISSGAGSSRENFNYGYFRVGDPTNGINCFSVDEPWSVDFWFKQQAFDEYFAYQASNLYSNSTIWTSYSGTYPNFTYRQQTGIRVWIANMSHSADTYSIYIGATDKSLVSGIPGNEYSLNCQTASCDAETWYHFCGVIDPGNTLGNSTDDRRAYPYVNGVFSSESGTGKWQTGEIYEAGTFTPSYTNTSHMYMGASSSQNSFHDDLRSNGAKGRMGAFKIYNRALTASEVLKNYDALKERYQ
jgi:hypothetical protein